MFSKPTDKTGPIPAATSLAQPGARIVNIHYVLMQSYFEEKTADKARDFLAKNGIPCTIERGVKGWRADFYQVIGLQGFTRPAIPPNISRIVIASWSLDKIFQEQMGQLSAGSDQVVS